MDNLKYDENYCKWSIGGIPYKKDLLTYLTKRDFNYSYFLNFPLIISHPVSSLLISSINCDKHISINSRRSQL